MPLAARHLIKGKKEKGEEITEKGTNVAEKVLQKEKNLSQFCL
jgi:Mn-dependent DtxR family transcriptional regulator